MPTPAVFISHSTARGTDDPYLSGVAAALQQGQFEVFLDRRELRPSDDWATRIVNWLAGCHAAVAILSEKALASDYVKFEVANLFARWERAQAEQQHPDEFAFCVIVPHTVSLADVMSGYYGTIGLPGQHLIQATSAEDAVQQVLGRLLPLKQRLELPATPIDNLRLRVEVLLQALDPRMLRLGLAELQTNPGPAEGLARQLADALLFSPLARSIAALQAMQPMPNPQATWQLYQLIAPSWVGLEAAIALRSRLENAANQAIHVTINADHPEFTPAMYLQRATGNLAGASGKVLDFTTLSGRRGITREALAHEVQTLFIEKMLGADADPDSDADAALLRSRLEFERDANRALIVAIKLGNDRLQTLRQAISAADYPGVTFLALCAAAPESEREFLLRPELQTGQEEMAYRNCVQAESIVKGLMNG